MGSVDLPGRQQHAQCDGQIEAPGFLRQIGGRQTYHDAPCREAHAYALDSGPYTLAALSHFGVGQPNDMKRGQAPATYVSTVTRGAPMPCKARLYRMDRDMTTTSAERRPPVCRREYFASAQPG